MEQSCPRPGPARILRFRLYARFRYSLKRPRGSPGGSGPRALLLLARLAGGQEGQASLRAGSLRCSPSARKAPGPGLNFRRMAAEVNAQGPPRTRERDASLAMHTCPRVAQRVRRLDSPAAALPLSGDRQRAVRASLRLWAHPSQTSTLPTGAHPALCWTAPWPSVQQRTSLRARRLLLVTHTCPRVARRVRRHGRRRCCTAPFRGQAAPRPMPPSASEHTLRRPRYPPASLCRHSRPGLWPVLPLRLRPVAPSSLLLVSHVSHVFTFLSVFTFLTFLTTSGLSGRAFSYETSSFLPKTVHTRVHECRCVVHLSTGGVRVRWHGPVGCCTAPFRGQAAHGPMPPSASRTPFADPATRRAPLPPSQARPMAGPSFAAEVPAPSPLLFPPFLTFLSVWPFLSFLSGWAYWAVSFGLFCCFCSERIRPPPRPSEPPPRGGGGSSTAPWWGEASLRARCRLLF